MTLQDFLPAAINRLQTAGISTARLDVLVLLEDNLGTDRAVLLAHPETELGDEQIKTLDEQIMRRASHIPLAYIRGKTEFYGREFYVDENVLEPRPESETMIDILKSLPDAKNLAIFDIGTGSGALAITAKLELSGAQVTAIDIDTACLDIAERNARALHAAIGLTESSLIESLVASPPKKSFALLCNLPYVPDNFQINTAASHEPRLAIFGGPDGLDIYRKLFTQVQALSQKPHYILTEALPPQHGQLDEIARNHGFTPVQKDDFIQVFSPAASPTPGAWPLV